VDGWLGFNGILSMQVAAISESLRLLLAWPMATMACMKEIIRLGRTLYSNLSE